MSSFLAADQRETEKAAGIGTNDLAELLRKTMSRGQIPYLTVTSNSMSPLLRQGDQVGIIQVSVDQLRTGDIVVMADEQGFITHRFYGLDRGSGSRRLITRGDRPLKFDRPHIPACLVGRVVSRHRNSRVLWLDRGAGARLNQFLARVSAFEARLFAGYGDDSDVASSWLGRNYSRRRQFAIARLVRRAYVFLAWSAAALIDRDKGRTVYTIYLLIAILVWVSQLLGGWGLSWYPMNSTL